jgi:hypothetical protein
VNFRQTSRRSQIKAGQRGVAKRGLFLEAGRRGIWASDNSFPIDFIAEQTAVEPPMPAWDELIVSHNELDSLWPTWRTVLAQWRGIYFILDQSTERAMSDRP